jgi:hypothetical protein
MVLENKKSVSLSFRFKTVVREYKIRALLAKNKEAFVALSRADRSALERPSPDVDHRRNERSSIKSRSRTHLRRSSLLKSVVSKRNIYNDDDKKKSKKMSLTRPRRYQFRLLGHRL